MWTQLLNASDPGIAGSLGEKTQNPLILYRSISFESV